MKHPCACCRPFVCGLFGALLLLSLAGCRLFPAAGLAACGLRSSFTVVPPGPITPGARVELRLALRNATAQETRVRVSARVAGAWATPIGSEAVSVPPWGTSLVRFWWRPGAGAGKASLRVRAESEPGLVTEHDWTLTVLPLPTAAPPWLQGVWLDPLGLLDSVYPRNRAVEERDVRAMVDSMARLGARVVVVTYVEYQGHFVYPSQIRFQDRDMHTEAGGQWFPFDALEAILSAADRRGMHVFLGVGRGGDTHLLWGGLQDSERLAGALDLGRRVAAELWERYSDHPSFYGWYLTHEMNDLAAAAAYYDPMADACHAFAPDKPVLVAPAGTPVITRDLLERSHVDIFAYQDAVGAGYQPGAYTYDPETRLAVLGEVFASYRQWHVTSTKHLWADVELWQMNGPTYAAAFPAAPARLARQIAVAARHAEFLTGYEYTGFLQDPRSELQLRDPRATQLFRACETWYRAALRRPHTHP